MGLCSDGGWLSDIGKRLRRKKKKQIRRKRNRPVARFRYRGDYADVLETIHHPLVTINPYYTHQVSHKPPPQREEITDTVGFVKLQWNPCHHLKYELDVGTLPDQVVDGQVVASPGGYSEDYLHFVRSNYPWPPGSLIDDLTTAARTHFEDLTPTDVKLANLILELLLVVKGLLRIALSISRLMSRLRIGYLAALQRFQKERLLRRAEDREFGPSDEWLAWNFAIKPFLSDIKKLVCSWEKARKRWIFLVKRSGKLTIVRFRRKNVWQPGDLGEWKFLSTFPDYYTGINPDPPLEPVLVSHASPWVVQWRVVRYELTFTCQGAVIFTMPLDVFGNPPPMRDVWLGNMGLFKPLEFLWEALPFSWLFDWCISAKAKLWTNLLNLSPIPPVDAVSACHAWKLESQFELRARHTGDGTTIPLGVGRYDVYSRSPGFPFEENQPLRVPLEWYNGSILLALLVQFKRRRQKA